MTRDKMTLEAKIMEMSSYKNEMLILQGEIAKLQVSFMILESNFKYVWKIKWIKTFFHVSQVHYDKALKESQQLIDENESLRNRLRDVVSSPLSDTEKQQIIDDSQQRLHSSAPASIALPNVKDKEIFV